MAWGLTRHGWFCEMPICNAGEWGGKGVGGGGGAGGGSCNGGGGEVKAPSAPKT